MARSLQTSPQQFIMTDPSNANALVVYEKPTDVVIEIMDQYVAPATKTMYTHHNLTFLLWLFALKLIDPPGSASNGFAVTILIVEPRPPEGRTAFADL